VEGHVPNAEVVSLVGERLSTSQATDDLQCLVEAVATDARVRVATEVGVLLRDRAEPGAEHEAPA